ncbi:hypothetical protein [Pyrobaculum neutrophilum]|uniref:Uncharacterized protein n=1 Tax=Pyrobaculum neutrophilum (strain DSM 2338 / JCM 9278 / NBRC 100436 / V24Sta) TaxID=444157 RepID=B1YAC3_PYRNV|nr:hypothetical protein [Pyrobaculum neutrophilum]ACB40572.1 conserved hypothetical protein [Pyrobaculum neutrophilum V24Sta]
MIVKVVKIRDVAIIKLDAAPCADVFIFRAEGRELEICGSSYVLDGEIEEFRRGLLLLGGVPYFVECDMGRCVAARAHV